MTITSKISGWSISDFDITRIFNSQFVWLSEAMATIKTQKAMDFLLDTFRFTRGCEERSNDWCAILDYDTIYKLSIMEKYPELEQELIERFGEKWADYYLRFGH